MSQMPPSIDQVFQLLKAETTWLHARWITFRQLFAHSPERVALLNQSAATLFNVIEQALLGEVQVALSQLTDPATTGKRNNLSFEQLQGRVAAAGDVVFAARTRGLLDTIHVKCQVIKARRSKGLAHLDIATAMMVAPGPLPGVTRSMVDDALQAIREYMNAIELRYDGTESAYERTAESNNGDALVDVLKRGLRYSELVESGQIPFTDLGD